MVRMGDKARFVYLGRGTGTGARRRATWSWRSRGPARRRGRHRPSTKVASRSTFTACARSARSRSSSCGRSPMRPFTSASKMRSGITRFEDDRRGANVVLSRRALLEEEMQVRAAETRGKLAVGAVLSGVVVAIKDFGAFVDVGGIEGLLPASEIGFQRGARPSDFLTVGQPVTVQVYADRKARRPATSRAGVVLVEGARARSWLDAAPNCTPGRSFTGHRDARRAVRRLRRGGAGGRGAAAHQRAGRRQPAARHAREAVKPGESSRSPCWRPIRRSDGSRWDWRRARPPSTSRAARAATRASGERQGLGTLGDLLKGKLPPRF